MSVITDFLDKLAGRQIPIPAATDYGFGGMAQTQLGHNQELFSPNVYGDYIATSNDVYSAAMLRAKSLAKLNLDFHDAKGELVPGGGAPGKLLQHVNPHWTFRRMLVQYELSMALWGQCYWVVESNSLGEPQELWWVKPTRMRPVVHPTEYITRYVYTPPDGGAPIPLDPSEVIWFRYPNVIDEFSGLSPMAAARLAADFGSSAMHTNQRLFDQGLMMGGAFFPPGETEISQSQADELEESLSRRFTGMDKAHRWAVFRHSFRMENMGVSPRDAAFIEGLNLSFRQVCRAMGVPSQLLNDAEFATLANLEIYERQLWEQTMEFEATFFADELNEQFLPMFRKREVLKVEFNMDSIAALQEDKQQRELREASQIADGRLTINEWRHLQNLEPVPWGDTWWATTQPYELRVTGDDPQPATQGEASFQRGLPANRAVDPFRPQEDELTEVVTKLLNRQLDSIISVINRSARSLQDAATEPFNLARWIAEYAEAGKPVIYATIEAGVREGGQAIGVMVGDDLAGLVAVVEERATASTMEFARRANESLFLEVRDSVAAGLERNESVEQLTQRIRSSLTGDGAEWRARRVASTETTKASSWGQMEVWRASGVTGKRWVTQGDSKVRDTHASLNGEVRGIDEGFMVGGCIADAPGLSGCAEEDVNCRCRIEPVTSRNAGVASHLREIADRLRRST